MKSAYDKAKAEQYWARRVSEVDELRAVLSYRLPEHINAAYSQWEIGLLLRDLGDLHGKKAADLGCGVGRVTLELLKAGAEVTALDNSEKMLSITTDKVQNASLSGMFRAVKASADENPLPSAGYDVAVCLGLLEHLPSGERGGALRHLYRILKPGAAAYIIVNNEDSIFLKRDRVYEMDGQADDGFFVGIIGMDFVIGFFDALNARVEILGDNSLYSYLRHTLDALGGDGDLEVVSQELMKLALKVDLEGGVGPAAGARLADQFLVKVTKPA